jgi:hypothetical protein
MEHNIQIPLGARTQNGFLLKNLLSLSFRSTIKQQRLMKIQGMMIYPCLKRKGKKRKGVQKEDEGKAPSVSSQHLTKQE